MNRTSDANDNDNSQRTSIGSAVRQILQESSRRRIVIRDRAGKKVVDLSALLALLLSIGAPILLGFVILGVLVEVIGISFERR